MRIASLEWINILLWFVILRYVRCNSMSGGRRRCLDNGFRRADSMQER
jgi:hypothetical protein